MRVCRGHTEYIAAVCETFDLYKESCAFEVDSVQPVQCCIISQLHDCELELDHHTSSMRTFEYTWTCSQLNTTWAQNNFRMSACVMRHGRVRAVDEEHRVSGVRDGMQHTCARANSSCSLLISSMAANVPHNAVFSPTCINLSYPPRTPSHPTLP